MPYMPIDPNEQNTSAPGSTTAQPVTGAASGSIGGGGKGGGQGATTTTAPTGGAPNNTSATPAYTNLTSYLQANAGHDTNVGAINSDIRAANQGAANAASTYKAAGVAAAQAHPGTTLAGWQQGAGAAPFKAATDAYNHAHGVANAPTASQLQTAFGNTYTGASNLALDGALTGPSMGASNPLPGASTAITKAAKANPAKPAPQPAPQPAAATPTRTSPTLQVGGTATKIHNVATYAHGGEIPAFNELTEYLKGRK